MKSSKIINPKKEDSYGSRQKKAFISFASELKLRKIWQEKVQGKVCVSV
jgi:hypothetical protein